MILAWLHAALGPGGHDSEANQKRPGLMAFLRVIQKILNHDVPYLPIRNRFGRALAIFPFEQARKHEVVVDAFYVGQTVREGDDVFIIGRALSEQRIAALKASKRRLAQSTHGKDAEHHQNPHELFSHYCPLK
jgi:hypothetical protein